MTYIMDKLALKMHLGNMEVQDGMRTLDNDRDDLLGRKTIRIGNLTVGTLYKQPLEVKKSDGTTIYVAEQDFKATYQALLNSANGLIKVGIAPFPPVHILGNVDERFTEMPVSKESLRDLSDKLKGFFKKD